MMNIKKIFLLICFIGIAHLGLPKEAKAEDVKAQDSLTVNDIDKRLQDREDKILHIDKKLYDIDKKLIDRKLAKR